MLQAVTVQAPPGVLAPTVQTPVPLGNVVVEVQSAHPGFGPQQVLMLWTQAALLRLG